MRTNQAQTTTGSKRHPLRVKLYSEAIKEARKEIDLNRTGRPATLRTRLASLNRAMLGGFRFGNTIYLAGLSGHGKSYLLNMLHQDFLNPELNGDLPFQFKLIQFNFEMSSSDEVLRTISSDTGLSYGDLISAEHPLSDADYNKALESMEKRSKIEDLFFVENPGNRFEILDTIDDIHKRFPDHRLVISVDHILLSNYFDEPDEVVLLERFSKMMVHIRKTYNPLLIVVGQMNDKIMDPRRREPSMQFPMMTDIHGSKQMYHAVDTMMVLHRPELLNIAPKYGPGEGYFTKDMCALHILKMRKGAVGVVPLTVDFAKGTFTDYVQPITPKKFGL